MLSHIISGFFSGEYLSGGEGSWKARQHEKKRAYDDLDLSRIHQLLPPLLLPLTRGYPSNADSKYSEIRCCQNGPSLSFSLRILIISIEYSEWQAKSRPPQHLPSCFSPQNHTNIGQYNYCKQDHESICICTPNSWDCPGGTPAYIWKVGCGPKLYCRAPRPDKFAVICHAERKPVQNMTNALLRTLLLHLNK